MNHQKIYDLLVQKHYGIRDRREAKSLHGYVESHHIIPECMGGPDVAENIVHFPAKAHYLAHRLLVKIHPDDRGLWFALRAMTGSNGFSHKREFRVNSRIYGAIKSAMSRLGRSPEHRAKLAAAKTGQKHTPEARLKMSISRTGKKRPPMTEDQKEKIRKAHLGKPISEACRSAMTGRKLTDEHRKRISEGGRKAVADRKVKV